MCAYVYVYLLINKQNLNEFFFFTFYLSFKN